MGPNGSLAYSMLLMPQRASQPRCPNEGDSTGVPVGRICGPVSGTPLRCAGRITQTFPATGCTALLRGPFDARHLPLHLRLHRHLLRAHFGARWPPEIVRPKAALVLAALLAAVLTRARNTEVLALITPADLLDLPLLGLGDTDFSHARAAAAHIALPIVAVRWLFCRARILRGGSRRSRQGCWLWWLAKCAWVHHEASDD